VSNPAAPNHLAIIMDGNRRWAYERNKPTKSGHDQGSKIIEQISRHAYDRGVSWLTLFAFSSENWRRSSLEIKGIMTVLDHYLSHEIQGLMKNNVRLRVIGDLQGFSNSILKKIDRAVQVTKHNTGMNLTVALGYGGQADVTQAVTTLAQKVKDGEIKAEAITPDILKSHLYTRELPAVDLLLRTGKEKRISNFLLWDLAYAELAFMDVLWPDFTIAMLDDVLNEFTARNRRFGGDELVMNASDVKTLPSAG